MDSWEGERQGCWIQSAWLGGMDLGVSVKLCHSHTVHCFRLRAHRQAFLAVLGPLTRKPRFYFDHEIKDSENCEMSLKHLRPIRLFNRWGGWWRECEGLALNPTTCSVTAVGPRPGNQMLISPPEQEHSCAWAEKAEKEICSLTYTWHFRQRQVHSGPRWGSNPESFTLSCMCAKFCGVCIVLFRPRHHFQAFTSVSMCL